MIRPATQASSALLVFLLALAAQAQTPTADEILRAARLGATDQQTTLRAQLRNDAGRTPFTISQDHGVVSYTFTNPDQQIQLALGGGASELRERKGGSTAKVTPARYDEKVRGTAITYEDLALRLLYWPNPKLLGEETMILRKAWKLEIQAPKGESQFAATRLWIDQQSGAALQIEGYGPDGRILKRFKVISPQKINGKWMLRTMRVETYDPGTHKVTDRTYLEVLGEEKPAG
ncbi:MAG: outer membrane lipoprotein-sorting protein [Terrimicrobiaceae bacterium]|nr:outer membrane lipoprotein-sorting protein [Terrimicrobiaceae bacterium]